jgi:hypothetical protein
MGWSIRSKLNSLPVIKLSDIDVESLASGSFYPKRVRFVMTHLDKCCTATFHSLAEIDSYCSEKVLKAKRKDFYGGDPRGISKLIEIHINWVLNTGSHAIEYESRNGPYLVLRSMDRSYREVHNNVIEHPRELIARTGQSTWQVYNFYAEGLPDIEEDPICEDIS